MVGRKIRSAVRELRRLRHSAATERALTAERDAIRAERDAARAERDQGAAEVERLRALNPFVPPGHFYSPIPAMADVGHDAARLFPPVPPRTLPGINLREDAQLRLLDECRSFYAELPFAPDQQPGLRYRFENGAYSYFDAITLYFMLRRLRPKRVIEVGSGHSSCVTLDTDERFLGGGTELVFVEPYPELLHSLLAPRDADRITIVPERLQDVPLARFEALGENDILFIDSTHVGKIGSDVCRLFDEILPALKPGVFLHVHDIFYPFEYPRYWIEEGRAWNEAYMLRAFLQYNSAFRIEFWNHFVSVFHPDLLERTMPLTLRNPGASLWLKRMG